MSEIKYDILRIAPQMAVVTLIELVRQGGYFAGFAVAVDATKVTVTSPQSILRSGTPRNLWIAPLLQRPVRETLHPKPSEEM